jgi:hypothetical protein
VLAILPFVILFTSGCSVVPPLYLNVVQETWRDSHIDTTVDSKTAR